MKKLLASMLATAMSVSLGISAFAATEIPLHPSDRPISGETIQTEIATEAAIQPRINSDGTFYYVCHDQKPYYITSDSFTFDTETLRINMSVLGDNDAGKESESCCVLVLFGPGMPESGKAIRWPGNGDYLGYTFKNVTPGATYYFELRINQYSSGEGDIEGFGELV